MDSASVTIITLFRGIGYGMVHRRGLKRLAYREGVQGRLIYAFMMVCIAYVLAIPFTLIMCVLQRLTGGWVFISLAYAGLAVILLGPLACIVLYFLIDRKINNN